MTVPAEARPCSQTPMPARGCFIAEGASDRLNPCRSCNYFSISEQYMRHGQAKYTTVSQMQNIDTRATSPEDEVVPYWCNHSVQKAVAQWANE